LTILIKLDIINTLFINDNIIKRRSGIIIKKLGFIKDLLSIFIVKNKNHISYMLGFISALFFSIIYIEFSLEYAVLSLIPALLIFEILNYFFGGSPDIIVMGVDSEEDMMKALKKTINRAVKEKNNDNTE